MKDFKVELLRIISDAIPELNNKVQAGAVDATTQPPYAAFEVPEEQPVRTMHGIVGYTTTFELTVFAPQLTKTEKLKAKLINILEGAELGGKSYTSSAYAYFHEHDLHSYSLSFKIK